MNVTVAYDLSPAMVESAIKNKLIELGWTPPAAQRQWVGLTAGERDSLFTEHYQWDDYGKAIEAKLKEKNNV